MKEPKIRFKGFQGEWEETTFGNRLLSIQTGTNLLGSTDNKGIPLLKMGNIQRGYFSFDKLERLDESVTPAVNCIAKYGDFYYNTRNTLELVGKGATWMQKKGIFAFNSNIARCSLDGVNTIFFNYLYNTRNVIKQVQARAKGTTSVAAVYQRDLDSIEFSLPSVDEQKALGSFFQHLDSLIQSTTKKIESLKQVKAASLQSMFPQEGETTPRVRFKGFEGEWEECLLKDKVNNITTGKLDANAMVPNGKYRFYTCGKEYFKIDKYAFDDEALLISGNGENVGYIHYYNGKFNAYQRTYVLTSFTLNVFYLEHYLKARLSIRINKEKSVANTPYIKMDTISDMNVLYPNDIAEQRAIASYFTSLDRQITLQTQRLEKLKQIKAACLDNMFV
ncbi:MAG: restriction endonuclease subunit S [Bacteroidales bacterium]|nr:restriction endonuclease subunit S [Bacteroidales bacterium]